MEFIISPNDIVQSMCLDYTGGSCITYKACPNVGICGTLTGNCPNKRG